ncbi:hypothetical protein JZK55_18080 [Dissulfurispira thermophila]|uniref:4Fe-4S domain-containing protein n=2 Tax=root TaxID=1 RepID=A0A7G1H4R7_9BACT|nr:DUF3786 domain-containing protein [Dissulfurispira thermophila]BCB96886.1 hypothetical protein JZK55_18080 [Dissulfurispira thermophila]
MNPIELYKKLPKKNCNQCKQKTCMPFALSVIKGEAELSECPHLTNKEIELLKGSITKSDWREKLILSLKQEVRNINFRDIAEGIGAELKEDNSLAIKCIGRTFIISPDGEVTTHGHITPWMKILLLHYIRMAGKGNLSGKWVSYSELKGGMVKAFSFQRDCEEPLKELIDRDFVQTEKIFIRLGAERHKGFPTDNAWCLYLLPKLPIMILYWPREEEFESKLKIIFDSTADRFLDAESIIFLVEGLVKNVEVNSKFADRNEVIEGNTFN